MAIIRTDDKHYKDIADAIRTSFGGLFEVDGDVYKPEEMPNKILEAFQFEHDIGHQSGYEDGHLAGWEAAKAEGNYDDGWSDGYNDGYEDGEQMGYEQCENTHDAIYQQGKTDGLAEGKEQGKAEAEAGYADALEAARSEGRTEGYESGKSEGITEGTEQGKQAERTAFWDVFQNNGGTANYYLAFAYGRFTDDNYNPRHPIRCSNASTAGFQMFYSSNITDTKVAIYANSKNLQQAFNSVPKLHTIRLLSVHETTTYPNTFDGATALENIEFEGTIGQDISFAHCIKLSAASAKSIIIALANYAGTENEYSRYVYFASGTITALKAEGDTAPHGGDWTDYISFKGWNT